MRSSLALLALALALAPCVCEVGHEKSVQSFTETIHKRTFDSLGLLVFGALSLVKSAVRGRVAVKGAAKMEAFDIGRDIQGCNVNNAVLTVAGKLTARMGQVHNGHIMCGRGSAINHSVRRSCSPKVEPYVEDHVLPLGELESSLIRESGDYCQKPPNAVMVMNGTVASFRSRDGAYSCYTVFSAAADDLRLVKEWKYEGDASRNVIINIRGRRATFQDFKMSGFNAARTIINICSTYARFHLYNSRFHAAVLAPTTQFSVMDTVVNGSMVVASMRGEIVVLRNLYTPC